MDKVLWSRRDVLGTSVKGGLALGLTPFIVSLVGCGGSGGGSNTVTRSASYAWTGTLLDTISAVRPGPPMAARAIALVATAVYDAWAAYDPVALGTRLGSQLRRPTVEHTLENKQKAISFAAYRMLNDLYPSQKARHESQMVALGYDPTDVSTDPTTPQGIGNRVASALMTFRHADGSNQLNNYADTTGYVAVNSPTNVVDPSRWQRLTFANGASPNFIAPHWGNVVPFALTSPTAVRPPAPPTYGSPTYLEQAQEVVDILARLNDRAKIVAEYWADGPGSVLPPGHWQLFGRFVSARDNHDLDQDVKMFFMLGNAVMDAGIACWECKRTFDTSRPITAIRALYAGRTIPSFNGTAIVNVDGAQWSPYQSPNFITPPFPEYTSGHSTFSAAASEILKRFTGSDDFGFSVTISTGGSNFESGIPSEPVTLSYSTFTEAANAAGLSRLNGGIHFRAGDLEGRRCGRAIGGMVYDVAMSYITGSAGSRLP